MPNPLISMIARSENNNAPGMQMLNMFKQFKSGWTPDAAKNKIDEMLRTGQINAQQLEQAKMMAQEWSGLLK